MPVPEERLRKLEQQRRNAEDRLSISCGFEADKLDKHVESVNSLRSPLSWCQAGRGAVAKQGNPGRFNSCGADQRWLGDALRQFLQILSRPMRLLLRAQRRSSP